MRTIGLLHDAGRLVLAANLPESFERVCQLAAEKGLSHWEAEREEFGTTHAEVGAYLFGLWGLPESIVEAVAYHHSPSRCPHPGLRHADGAARRRYPLIRAMRRRGGFARCPTRSRVSGQHGTAADRLPEWRELARQVAAEEVAAWLRKFFAWMTN